MSPKSHSGRTCGLRMMMMIMMMRTMIRTMMNHDDADDDDHDDDDDDYKPESTDRCDREWASYFRWLSSYLGKIVLYI